MLLAMQQPQIHLAHSKSLQQTLYYKNISHGGIVSGTGHNSLLRDKAGKVWCVYHARTTKTGSQRLVFLDELKILPNGQLIVDGPTVKP